MCEITSLEQVEMRKQVLVFLVWTLWTKRNVQVFENKFTPNTILIAIVNRMVDEFGKY